MLNSTSKIFIVDDEPLLTEMLEDYLTDNASNLRVQSFPTGEDCLESLDQNPDLIILDYYLNARAKDAANGIDILKAIKAKNKALPVIMLSSQKSYATAAKMIQHGAMHYVMKGEQAFPEILQVLKANL